VSSSAQEGTDRDTRKLDISDAKKGWELIGYHFGKGDNEGVSLKSEARYRLSVDEGGTYFYGGVYQRTSHVEKVPGLAVRQCY